MVSLKENVGPQSLVDGQDAQQILNFIASEGVVTLEMIVAQFPWIRWGDLFRILGNFRREGLMTVYQVDQKMELRINKHALNVY